MKNQGYRIAGSDDAIYEPAKSNLQKLGLMPGSAGWFPDKITIDIDAIILGMHAKADNPELVKAQTLGLKIYSFPEFVFEQCKNRITNCRSREPWKNIRYFHDYAYASC